MMSSTMKITKPSIPAAHLYELEILLLRPDVIRLLRDYHDSQSSQAEAMGYDNADKYHQERSKVWEDFLPRAKDYHVAQGYLDETT